MAAHRYWRIRIISSFAPSGSWCALHEVEMRETVGGVNAISGGTATASTQYSAEAPADAIDGDPATRWLSDNEAPCWWQYEFPSDVDIAELVITAGNDGAGQTVDYQPAEFELLCSHDGTTWRHVASFTESAWSASETRNYDVGPAEGENVYTLTVTNGDAETGDTTGWTVTSAGWQAATVNDTVHPGPYEGTFYFYAGAVASTAMHQDLAVPAAAEADIDAGKGGFAFIHWRANTYSNTDYPKVRFRFLDGVGTEVGVSHTVECHTDTGVWRSFELKAPVPVGARTIRLELDCDRTSGSQANGYLDAISDVTLQTGTRYAALANAGCYGGSLANWTKVSGAGTLQAEPWASGSIQCFGSHSFLPGINGGAVYEQIVSVPTAAESNIDAGGSTCSIEYRFANLQALDAGRLNLRFLDGADVELGTHTGAEHLPATGNVWAVEREEASVPIGTRKIAVQMESIYYSGTHANAYFDEIGAIYFAPPPGISVPLQLQWGINAGSIVNANPLDLRWGIISYIEGSLGIAWRVGFESDSFAALAPYGATYLEGTTAAAFLGERDNDYTGDTSPEALDGAISDGAISAISTVLLADSPGALALHFAGDYYYRIWVIPDSLTLQNPQLGVPIPFEIWNAYPWDNNLDSIGGTGQTGLSLNLSAPSLFTEIELREVEITIGFDAPPQITAEFIFDFAQGSGTLDFSATIAEFVQMVPDPPVTEYWEWLTDIITGHDGSEQRIALRGVPRRYTSYSFMLEDEGARRRQAERWFKSLASRIVLPYYQYAGLLEQTSAIGATKLFFDPQRVDVRDEEFVIVLDAATETGFLVKLDAVVADGATLAVPLTSEMRQGWVVSPAFTSRLADGSGPRMRTTWGNITVDAEALDVRPQFKRPGSTATINTFDGYPVLDRRPLADEEVPENYTVNYEVIDSRTGLLNIKTSWPHPFMAGERKFLVQRYLDPEEMDWWRDFLGDLRGMQNPFLLPTWRQDLTVPQAPSAGSSQLLVSQTDYVSLYFPYESYKRLQIETAGGTIWRKVLQATNNGDGTVTLELDNAFGLNPEDVDVRRVSFLNLARLGRDRVKLSHAHHTTTIAIGVRTVDA